MQTTLDVFCWGVKEKWTLPDDITMTTDNAAVEVKSCRDINWPRIGCAGHTINLIVLDVLKDKTLSRLVAKGRNIVSHFHKSPFATNALAEKQSALQPQSANLKLIQDVVTRWNSTLDMLKRLLELNAPLHALAHDGSYPRQKDLKSLLYASSEQDIVERVVQILTPFKKATEMLSSESSPTLSMVIPAVIALGKTVEEDAIDDDEEDSKIKKIERCHTGAAGKEIPR